jgi:glycine betaine catabolism B
MAIGRFTKAVVVLNCTVPAILLGWDAFQGRLGANPVNFAIRTTGLLCLIFLMLSLTVTPASRLLKLSWLGQFRRVMGLYAFFHAALHFSLFFLFDRSGNVGDTLSEIGMRPYLLVGIIGLLIMVPLAVTSTNRMIQRLGPKRWKLLHRTAYIASIAGVLHFYMLVKADTTRPLVVAAILGVLLGYRLVAHYLMLRSEARKYRMAPLLPALAASQKPKPWTGSLRVAKVFVETPDVKTFRLVPLPTAGGGPLPFTFLPGQYLNLALEIDGRKVRRSYTIASSPSRNAYCELTVKREPQGLSSRYLHETLREGDLLSVTAPAGRFTFTGNESDRIVLIAGGVGITPLMSKIRYLTDIAWPGSICLIVSVKTEADIIFRTELDELSRRFANLQVVVTLTREPGTTWTGLRGRIAPELLKSVVPNVSTGLYHLCGPTEMTDPVIAMLRTLEVPEPMIHVESFASPSRTAAGSPIVAVEDVAEISEAASLEFVRSKKRLTDLNGRTILELAEDHGISIPYDCRSGICGQCKTRLLSGSVVMEADDALDPVDRANGLILACQARCRDEVVVDA